jgi:hypothetical protein
MGTSNNLPAVLTLIFAGLGALGPIITLALYYFSRRREKREVLAEAAAPWSLDLEGGGAERLCTLRLDEPITNRSQLMNITAEKPRGLLLAHAHFPYDNSGVGHWERNGEYLHSLQPERDMKADVFYGPGQTSIAAYSTIRFYVSVPPRPWYRRTNRTRVAISIVVEERSSRRTRRRFTVRSQPMDWAANR